MERQLKAIVVVLTVAMLMAVAAFLPAHLNAGNLEPTGPPGPTMKTLDEIYQAITPLPTGFVLWEDNPRFHVDGQHDEAEVQREPPEKNTRILQGRRQRLPRLVQGGRQLILILYSL